VITVEQGRTHARERESFITIEDSGIDPGFQIYRRAGLYLGTTIFAVIAGGASVVAATMQGVDWMWAPAGILFVLGLIALPGIIDARIPVLVADRYGVRLHQGDNWVGLLWREISEVVVDPGGGGRDARIRIVGKDARQTYACPVGIITTTASVSEAEVELAWRRAAAAY
jgi:hypothetical protein